MELELGRSKKLVRCGSVDDEHDCCDCGGCETEDETEDGADDADKLRRRCWKATNILGVFCTNLPRAERAGRVICGELMAGHPTPRLRP